MGKKIHATQKGGGALGKKKKKKKSRETDWYLAQLGDVQMAIEKQDKKEKTDVADITELIRHYRLLGDKKAALGPPLSLLKGPQIYQYIPAQKNSNPIMRIMIQNGKY